VEVYTASMGSNRQITHCLNYSDNIKFYFFILIDLQADLYRQTFADSPVSDVCPRMAILSRLSCLNSPVMFWPSCPLGSVLDDLPRFVLQVNLFRLTFPGCPVLVVLSQLYYPCYLVLAVLPVLTP
jgi:hypothetical protein